MPGKDSATGGKRYPLNMRTTKEVRERLEEAAAESGRSLVQEVENRIEISFRYDSIFETIGGKEHWKIIRPILFFFGNLENRGFDRSWRKNPAVAKEMRQAVGFIVEAALADEPLPRERQVEALEPFFFGESGKVAPKNYPREGHIMEAAVTSAQALGLAEGRPFGGTESQSVISDDSFL